MRSSGFSMPHDMRIMLSGMPIRAAVFRRALVIAHHQRLLDERLDAAQARRDARNPHRVDDVGRRPPIGVLHQERHQAAEAAHLSAGRRRDTGAIRAPDSTPFRRADGVSRNSATRWPFSLCRCIRSSNVFRPRSEQVTILRAVDRTHDAAQVADRLHFLGRADHHAGQQIVVPGQVFRDRMEHVIDARLDRPQVVRRGQRGVDERLDAVLIADFGEPVQIDDAQVRIGGRLADRAASFWA